MFCPNCGGENPDNSTFCSKCGKSLTNQYTDEKLNDTANTNYQNNNYPNNNYQNNNYQNNNQNTSIPGANENVPNYLVFSILVTILCCLPLGIAAIVFSSQVDGKLRSGDYYGALDSSKKAKTFCIISLISGIVVGIIYIILFSLGMLGSVLNQ
ncbi:MAG: CD225/dispanin family protein [Bacillota bacterium]|nr:CD225/dispanin family protein [Bacillota bacterium]